MGLLHLVSIYFQVGLGPGSGESSRGQSAPMYIWEEPRLVVYTLGKIQINSSFVVG